ncbi:RDD family protein [compost metagenome]
MLYFGVTVGGREQASPGMRMMGLAIARTDGRPMDFLTAIVHLVIFWIANALLTPLVLLIGLFTDRSRLLHDLLIGTVTVRRDSY